MLNEKFIILSVILCLLHLTLASVPILIWHGMMANPHKDSDFLKQWIRDEMDGNVTIKSIDITTKNLNEKQSSVFVHPIKQIERVCDELKSDEKLKNGFHAIGLSQGGQFMRGLIQRCPSAKVINFISFGGQHQGIYGIPNCSISPNTNSISPCRLLRQFLSMFAYTDWAQNNIAQATYWHDPTNVENYIKYNTFIANINNEKTINKDYIYRLQQLNKFVMVKFLRDKVVIPVETQWFGFYHPKVDGGIQNMTESSIYRFDRLGLKKMMEDGKIIFLQIDDGHLNISHEWFLKEIMPLLRENEGMDFEDS